ncbi:uncharacterized protein LOC128233570 [Mya arenaria]|uniref:uncharacterized protein LOC128233570 n=1 Tax=Mya arenaria TaxID=6604 RepID=UPI0022E127A2|nr:uncharacterized protein LOC128233570 [Mya arenaria]
MKGDTQFQIMNAPGVIRYSEDRSLFLKWWASNVYNRSHFYAGCSTNTTIRTRLISLNMKDIVGTCGALVLLGPIVRDAEVKLGYFPSDYSIQHQAYSGRTWKKNLEEIELRIGSYEEEIVSEYFYVLVIFNFDERDEGMYILSCNESGNTDSVQLQFPDPPSDISMSVIKTHDYNKNSSACFLDVSCQTKESNPPCTIEWSSDNDNLRYINSSNWTKEEGRNYLSVFNALYRVTKDKTGGTITCSTKCDHFPSHLYTNDTVYVSSEPTMQFNTTSPVHLYPNITVIVKCLVDDCHVIRQWTLRWEDENKTEIKTCRQTEECLLTLNYTGDEEMTYSCIAWKSDELLRNSMTVLNTMTKEATTNPALGVTQHLYTVIYAVSGSVLLLLVTTYTSLICRHCKPHVYEMLLRRRRTAGRERSAHVYDDVQPNLETTELHNIQGVSARAVENRDAPPLNIEGIQVCSKDLVSHYDYVDPPSTKSNRRTI